MQSKLSVPVAAFVAAFSAVALISCKPELTAPAPAVAPPAVVETDPALAACRSENAKLARDEVDQAAAAKAAKDGQAKAEGALAARNAAGKRYMAAHTCGVRK